MQWHGVCRGMRTVMQLTCAAPQHEAQGPAGCSETGVSRQSAGVHGRGMSVTSGGRTGQQPSHRRHHSYPPKVNLSTSSAAHHRARPCAGAAAAIPAPCRGAGSTARPPQGAAAAAKPLCGSATDAGGAPGSLVPCNRASAALRRTRPALPAIPASPVGSRVAHHERHKAKKIQREGAEDDFGCQRLRLAPLGDGNGNLHKEHGRLRCDVAPQGGGPVLPAAAAVGHAGSNLTRLLAGRRRCHRCRCRRPLARLLAVRRRRWPGVLLPCQAGAGDAHPWVPVLQAVRLSADRRSARTVIVSPV